MAVDYKAAAESLLWKQNSKYTRNYAKSIGTAINGDANHAEMVIDLENANFYNPKSGPISFYADKVNVDGSLSADSCMIDGLKINVETENIDGSNKKKAIIKFNEKKLDITPTEIDGVIATKSELNRIKESLNLDKDKLITFLEIIKFIPELSNKRAEIESLIETLNRG